MLVAAAKLSSERRWWRVSAFPVDACAARRKKINQCDRLIHLSNTPAHSHLSHHLSNTTDRTGHTHTYLHTWYRTHPVWSLLWSRILLVALSSNHLSALYAFLKKKKGIFESGHIWNLSKPERNTEMCLNKEAAKLTLRQTDRQTDRQTHTHTERDTHTHTHTHTHTCLNINLNTKTHSLCIQ